MRCAVLLVLAAGVARADEPKPDLTGCAKNNAKACLETGLAYVNGLGGVKKDEATALKFYAKACDLKNAAACGYAGTMYTLGRGTPKDVKKGRDLRVKACEGNDGPSCNDLGTSWADATDGVDKKDPVKARRYYDLACRANEPTGCFNAGNAFREGEGGPKDPKQAAAAYQKSCDGKLMKGCTELAIAYYEGNGVTKDVLKAVEIMTTACKGGSETACKNLELLKK